MSNQNQRLAKMIMKGTGPNKPTADQHFLAANCFRRAGGKKIADGFRDAEAHDEGNDRRLGNQPELFLPDQRDNGPFQADHHPREYVDQYQERELAKVLTQT